MSQIPLSGSGSPDLGTDDVVYGPLETVKLRRDRRRQHEAVYNADSYGWFATVSAIYYTDNFVATMLS